MIVKEAGLERANMMDTEHGSPILISTTARKFFREQFPDHAKTRNWVVNQYLAGMYASGRPTNYFRPKKGDENDVGEIRQAGGGTFVGIVGSDHVRVIAVKGGLGGSLPALPPQVGEAEQTEMFGETATVAPETAYPAQPTQPAQPQQTEMFQQPNEMQGVEEALQVAQ